MRKEEEEEGKDYFVAYVYELPYLVLADSHTYFEGDLDKPIFFIEGVNPKNDELFLEKIEPNPLLARNIAKLLNHCLGEALLLIDQEEL